MTTTSITATFPIVDSFWDYHEIDYLAAEINKLGMFDKKIRCEEVGFCGDYWGVFYVGRKPAKAVIDKMLADAGYEPGDNEPYS